jgi:hypothetical protein
MFSRVSHTLLTVVNSRLRFDIVTLPIKESSRDLAALNTNSSSMNEQKTGYEEGWEQIGKFLPIFASINYAIFLQG